MTGKRLYHATTRKRAPLDLDQLTPLDLLAILLRSRKAARTITTALHHHPDLWDLEPADFMTTLTTLPTVGPSAAATFVIAEIYAHKRLHLTAPRHP